MRNLDTGEEMNIDEAEDQLPATINPLSLHIMRMTSEYVRSVIRNLKVISQQAVSSIKKASALDSSGRVFLTLNCNYVL